MTMSTRESLARLLCRASGKVDWTEHIPAVHYDQADAILATYPDVDDAAPEPADEATSPYDDLRFYVAGLVGTGAPEDYSPGTVACMAIGSDETVREMLDAILAEQQVAWEDRLAASEAVSAEHLEHAWSDGYEACREGRQKRNPYRKRSTT